MVIFLVDSIMEITGHKPITNPLNRNKILPFSILVMIVMALVMAVGSFHIYFIAHADTIPNINRIWINLYYKKQ